MSNFPKWMGVYPRANAAWSGIEEEELRKGYDQDNLTFEQLCEKHGRTPGGISERLMKCSKKYQNHCKVNLRQELEELKEQRLKLNARIDEIYRILDR